MAARAQTVASASRGCTFAALVLAACMLALLGMLVAQGQRELAKVSRLYHAAQRDTEKLKVRLRRCERERATVIEREELEWAPDETGAGDDDVGLGEHYLARAELLRTNVWDGIAMEDPGWCHCPPPTNWSRACAAYDGPRPAETRALELEAEAVRLRRIVDETNTHAQERAAAALAERSEIALALERATAAQTRLEGEVAEMRARCAGGGGGGPPTAAACEPFVASAQKLLAEAVTGRVQELKGNLSKCLAAEAARPGRRLAEEAYSPRGREIG